MSLIQKLREVRTLKELCKPLPFGLRCTHQLLSSPNLLLMFASDYINTVKQLLFLKYISDKKYRPCTVAAFKAARSRSMFSEVCSGSSGSKLCTKE